MFGKWTIAVRFRHRYAKHPDALATFVVEGETPMSRTSRYVLDDEVIEWMLEHKISYWPGKRNHSDVDVFDLMFQTRADAARFILVWM
jgi:hypothetical protein